MKAVKLIRKYGLFSRMDQPGVFIREMNKLCIQMTHARNAKDSKKERKKIFRLMKKLIKKIKSHGERYRDLLSLRWNETILTEKQALRIVERMDKVLLKLPVAIKQAHERIIGERKIKNEDKILSLYEDDIHVVIRKKADALVEFGNKLLLGEQTDGIIIDWKLYKEKVPAVQKLLEESLKRLKLAYKGRLIESISGDRGFFNKKNQRFLETEKIKDYICPKPVGELRCRILETDFIEHQNRRAQTEARIGILKNKFLGKLLRSKGYTNRERSLSWAVLAHNLWIIARLHVAVEKDKIKTA